jgi:hypothetical protein
MALHALGGQLTESASARLRCAAEVGGWRRASIRSISCSMNGTMRVAWPERLSREPSLVGLGRPGPSLT